ncbi:Glycine dehydrogenase (decarboxylating) subunit 2 [Estrella lausannensis]|uniref:glycine dehydrogenase (aminomethyl-transferring) n=2 Tax=Estrella lausannensis TaxID=483423 RepID=A0A0H5DQ09_9BACT|nr:aminomethyl-transferring glycine dehydrogenase subunit GcvPB [Estrella lausannensis]CRX37599.1 Glycine dehydrogenase (decarboxylating) subunit 2 [Estrella lausannensis]
MNSAVTIFEKSQEGQKAYSLPYPEAAFSALLPPVELEREEELPLPQIAEIDIIRHYSTLSRNNLGIDTTFYPLGSCTMKLNPKANDEAASNPGFVKAHPLSDDIQVQGCLRIIYELIEDLSAITGMHGGSLAPAAGAQGEFAGLKIIEAYHRSRGERRPEVLIPDSAHGTNPASAALVGLKTIPIRSGVDGDLDMEMLKEKLSSNTAALMLTNPSTLGLFSKNILQISSLVHDKGGLLYYDGANLNAILNVARPGDMGFDVMHLNLHKTFSTPHGGGGPGSGPVLVKDFLKEFLPLPRVIKEKDGFRRDFTEGQSIGRVASFQGNFGVYLRAYLYIKLLGMKGLRHVAENAVLNANYLKTLLAKEVNVPFQGPCMHEFVIQCDSFLEEGVRALDIAKRLLDYGFYSPTVYFPLIIKECMLVEPTETESKRTLDAFAAAFTRIIEEIREDPDLVKSAPHKMSVKRLDEVQAARQPVLTAL